MPGLASDQATLEEILEVRAEPLNEEELWSILLEGGSALKSVLGKTAQERLLHLALTLRPDTLLLCLNGRIKFAITKRATANKNFIAPESFSTDGKCIISRIEKMLIYCLGMTTLAAAENCLDEKTALSISPALEQLLLGMVDESSVKRFSVNYVTKTALHYVDLGFCYSKINALASEIVGPYGLQPLSYLKNLPDIPTGNYDDYPFDLGLEKNNSLSPLQSLPSLLNVKQSPNGFDVTDCKSYSTGSEEDYTPKKISQQPTIKRALTPRSMGEETKRLPEKPKVNKIPQEPKPWSPTLSSPDFQQLLKLEEEKLKMEGYMRDPATILSPNRSLSMPSLNDVDDSQAVAPFDSKQISIKSNGYKQKPQYKSLGILEDRASLTSQYSSQISLTRGAYVLESDSIGWSQEFPIKRFYSGSSVSINQGDGRIDLNVPLPLRPVDSLELAHLGPEFVKIAENPDEAVLDIAPPRLGPLPKGARKICVNLPNNQQIQTNVQVNAKTKEVFEQVVEHIKLKETLYFGLTHVKDGEEMFLDLDTKLIKYAPTGWKDENPKKRKADFVLYFRVKFFLQNPAAIKHCLTVHFYFLQLRQYILSGYTQCPDDVLMNLSSYALQAEYGPYLPEYNGVEYFKKEFYIPGKVLSRMNRAELLRNLPRLHQSRSDLSKEDAELAFLEQASTLPEYGVIFHKVSRSKKIESDFVWLGIRIIGIVIIEPRGKQRATVHEQSWDSIKEFTFEKKKFILKPKSPDEHPKLTFYTNHYRKSKYLFKMCQSFHRFQIFHQTRVNQLSRRQDHGPEKKSKHSASSSKKPPQNSKTTKVDSLTVAKSDSPEGNLVTVSIKKPPNEELGLVIIGGENSKRIAQGIFIKTIKPNSICAKDGRLNEGDKIVLVNGRSLESSSHEEAAVILKESDAPLELVIRKTAVNVSMLDKSGLSPNMDKSSLLKLGSGRRDSSVGSGSADDVKKKLSNISFVDDESEGPYSERPVDVDTAPSDNNSDVVSKCDSEYDDPDELDQDVNQKFSSFSPTLSLEEGMEEAKHRKNNNSSNSVQAKLQTATHAQVLVNNVNVDQSVDSLSEQPSDEDESEITPTPSNNLSGLKRFSGFQGALNKIGSSDGSDMEGGNGKTSRQSDDVADDDGCIGSNDESVIVSPVNQTLDETIEEIDVELEKNDGSLGFSIHGGKESNLPLGCIYVRCVQPDGAAALSKRIRSGDRILAVNGISLENISHAEAVDILRRAPAKTNILLDRGIDVSDSQLVGSTPPPVSVKIASLIKSHKTVFEVDIEKRSNGFGLSLAGGRDSDMCYNEQIMIKKLFPGYVMHESGRFQVGDIILAINDQILEGMSYQEATAVIRSAPTYIRFIAKRPNPDDIPRELFETSRPVSPEKLLKDCKYLAVDGRGSGQGSRIAKELLESMTTQETEDEESAIGFPLSSQIITRSEDDQINDVDDGDEPSVEFPLDPPDKLTQKPVTQQQEEDDSTKKFDPTGVAEHKQANDKAQSLQVMKKSVVEKQSSSDSTDSPLGYRRHRPPKQQQQQQQQQKTGKSKDDIELATKDSTVEFTSEETNKKQVVETTFTVDSEDSLMVASNNSLSVSSPPCSPSMTLPNLPKDKSARTTQQHHHRQGNESPVLHYPSSPGALKNLNILSRSSSFTGGRTRRTSSGSRTSSTGEIISLQLEKGEKGLGITLTSNNDDGDDNVESFVYIKKLVAGSVAEKNGRLHAGDRILSVNGKNVESFSKAEVVSVFRQISGTVSMEFYRSPDQSPFASHRRILNDSEESSLTLPKPPPVSPEKVGLSRDQITSEEEGKAATTTPEIVASASTPNNLIAKEAAFDYQIGVSSEEITFDSNDGFSFTDSLLGSGNERDEGVHVEGNDKLKFCKQEKISMNDDDDDSIDSTFSFSGMDQNGILVAESNESENESENMVPEKLVEDLANKESGNASKNSNNAATSAVNRPPSDNASARTSPRTGSGIPRLVRSRSNSLNSGFSSRRSSAGSAVSATDAPSSVLKEDENALDDSQEHFIERKSFSYYKEIVVRTMLQDIEKKSQSSFLNPEFMALRQIKNTETFNAASFASNRSKNRIKTILPFDSNRVLLTGGEESDYINASHIKIKPFGAKNTLQYIVTQAPLSTTVEDFWRCVWERKIEVIVMLTKEEENGKVKCHKYWPAVKKTPTKILDKFTVELLYEEYNGSYIYRQIQIRNLKMDKSIFVTQGCFTQWPDTGVPQDAIEFLGFMKFIRNFSVSAPVLVHCSAGVGRSGVYVVVDSIWNCIEQDLSVDVAKMTRQAKEQRHMLIQTKEQYGFIYEVVRELFLDLQSTFTRK